LFDAACEAIAELFLNGTLTKSVPFRIVAAPPR